MVNSEGIATVPDVIVKPVVLALLLNVLVPAPEKMTEAKSAADVSMVPFRAWVVPSKRMVPPPSVKESWFV